MRRLPVASGVLSGTPCANLTVWSRRGCLLRSGQDDMTVGTGPNSHRLVRTLPASWPGRNGSDEQDSRHSHDEGHRPHDRLSAPLLSREPNDRRSGQPAGCDEQGHREGGGDGEDRRPQHLHSLPTSNSTNPRLGSGGLVPLGSVQHLDLGDYGSSGPWRRKDVERWRDGKPRVVGSGRVTDREGQVDRFSRTRR
jgi:hypothetical protein